MFNTKPKPLSKVSLLSVLCILYTWLANGQAVSDNTSIQVSRANFAAKTIAPPAPEAAELGKYGNVPVSLYTGTPQINIPLYELKGNSLSLPLGLSYNASGFNPQSIATWVGLYWSLNAGGVITRSALGNPDNSTNYFINPSPFTAPLHTDFFAFNDYKRDIQSGTKETRPDVYFFNFAGRSGKFYLNPDKSVFKKEKDNLKIEHCIDCTESYFIITDEEGAKYTFSTREITQQIPDDEEGALPAITYIYPSAWYLTTVTSADGKETLEFEYYATTEMDGVYNNSLQNTSVSYTQLGYEDIYQPLQITSHTSTPPSISIKRQFLKKINYKKNGILTSYVDFISATGLRQDVSFTEARLLQQIKVYSNMNAVAKLVKQYNFSYSYFTKTSAPAAKLLRLDNVQEVPIDGSSIVIPPYSFEYNTNTIPHRSTLSLDHWGYYNWLPNSSLIPTISYGEKTFGYGANREPSLDGCVTAMLKKIKYPTGGYTTFDYELNNDESNNLIGGLRVKEIIDFSFDNNKAVSKKFSYLLDNGTSSGKSNKSLIVYHKLTSFHHYQELDVLPPVDPSEEDYTNFIFTISTTPMFSLGAINGSHIGYSQVAEYLSDVATNEPLGKTVYNYEVKPFHEYDDDIANGDLLRQRSFDNAGKVIKEITNTYNYINTGTLLIHTVPPYEMQDNKTYYCKKASGSTFIYEKRLRSASFTDCAAFRNYPNDLNLLIDNIRGQNKQLVQKTEKIYDQATTSYQTNTTSFTYGSSVHTYPTVIEQNSSANDRVVTTKKYSGDYNHTTGTPDLATNGLLLLKSKNINGVVIETQQYRKNADGTNKRYIGGSLTTYLNSAPYPEKIYSLDIDQPVNTLTESAISNGAFTYDSRYRLAGIFKYLSSTGNLVEQAKADDILTSYIWDYSEGLPVASTVNAGFTEVAYTGFETAALSSWQMEQVTFNTSLFIAGNRSGVLPTSGRIYKLFQTTHTKPFIVSYWSRNGAMTVKYNGATTVTSTAMNTRNGWTYYEHNIPSGMNQVEIKSTVSATIDEVRLFPKGAQMTTFSYQHLVGVITQNPPTQDMVYYEYDGFSRLKNIKDNKGDILKNYSYNYGTTTTAITAPAATMWYNQAVQQTLAKQGCPAGTSPTSVTYKVPYGKYVSSISLSDANRKANEELTANAQAYANANGQCLYWNVQKSKLFTRNNCTYEQGLGWKYTYVVPANTYSSPVNQAAADALAQADIDANGQNAANLYGTCTCDTEDKKYINGACQTGTRNNISTALQPNGQWKCTYQYIFSNGTTKGPYYSYGSSACPISN